MPLAACDPCTGIASCDDRTTARVIGRLVEYPSREGVSGAQVIVTPADGAPVTTTSDAEGHWTAVLPAGNPPLSTVSVTVRAPQAIEPYTVNDIAIRAGARRGEATDVGRWFATPHVRFVGQLNPRPGIDLRGAAVTAVRTGGSDGPSTPIRTTMSAGRQFYIDAPGAGLEPQEYRITIEGPKLPRAYVREGVLMIPQIIDMQPNVQGVFSVGSALQYLVRIERRGLDAPQEGVRATFRRTGGVSTRRPEYTTTSNALGQVLLDLQPTGDGVVIGDLILRPPSPLPVQTITGLRLQTKDDDSLRLAAVVRVGSQVRSVFTLFRRTVREPVTNVKVEFRSTSGLFTGSISTRTDAAGFMGVVAPVNSPGTVRGDLTVFYAPPRPPEVFAGVQLTAAADDTVRLAGNLGVGPSLLYVGALQDIDTFRPITNGTAEFRRTGGIAVREAVFTWTITPEGYYRVAPFPLADGEVIGNLTFRLKPPYRDTTFVNVRLKTFTDDGTRNAGVYRVRR
jgi:hypothetical protein